MAIEDNQENCSDIVSREADFDTGLCIEVSEELLRKKPKSKKAMYKKVHEVKHESSFINIDEVREIVLEDSNIDFDNSISTEIVLEEDIDIEQISLDLEELSDLSESE